MPLFVSLNRSRAWLSVSTSSLMSVGARSGLVGGRSALLILVPKCKPQISAHRRLSESLFSFGQSLNQNSAPFLNLDHLRRAFPALELLVRSAKACVATILQFNFSLYPVCLPSLPWRCWSQGGGDPPGGPLHASFWLRVSFSENWPFSRNHLLQSFFYFL